MLSPGQPLRPIAQCVTVGGAADDGRPQDGRGREGGSHPMTTFSATEPVTPLPAAPS